MHDTSNAWLRIGLDAWTLTAEALCVAGLRLTKIATGGMPSIAEAQLMMVEKVKAAAELETKAMLGTLGGTPLVASRRTLSHYRTKVAANRRGLLR